MAKFTPLCWFMSVGIFVATMFVYHVDWSPHARLTKLRYESVELGNSIALKGSFSDPFAPLATGPSAHVGPIYPALVALIIKVFGTGPNGNFALMMLTKLVVGAQLALFPLLAEYMGLHCLTGTIAAIAWLVADFPLLPWESDFAGLLIVILAFPMYRAFRSEFSDAKAISVGVLWGLLLLLTPTPVLILGAWLVCLRVFSRCSWRKLSFLAMVPLLIVLPWLIRNYRVFHKPVFVRDNLGMELAVSNNSCATFSLDLNREGECFKSSHPNESFEEASRVRELGEANYNQVRMREALSWIEGNRSQFSLLTWQRFVAFWFPNSTGNPLDEDEYSWSEWITYAFTLLSIPGLWVLWRNHRFAAVLFSLWLLFFPLVYYFIHFSPRYRHPILWATLLPGSYLIVTLLFKIGKKFAPAFALARPAQRRSRRSRRAERKRFRLPGPIAFKLDL
jgi:hypothetical protein